MTTENKIDVYRRNFVGGAAAAVAGVAIAPGVILNSVAHAKPADKPVDNSVRWGILIDANKCDGCSDCVEACNEEHGLNHIKSRDTQKTQYIRVVNLRDKATGHEQALPVMCQHCETAPCVDVCPTGASMRREDGICKVDMHICIGCRYCMMACPYKARSFVHEALTEQKAHSPRGKGCVESCNMCVHRVDNDMEPACVVACNKHHGEDEPAMFFGDLYDENSEISQQLKKFGGKQIRADLGLNTGVRYRGL